MAKNKKTVKQSMHYWHIEVGPVYLRVRARTARTAIRKVIRGNLNHAILICEFELNNPSNPLAQMPIEQAQEMRTQYKPFVSELRHHYIQRIQCEREHG